MVEKLFADYKDVVDRIVNDIIKSEVSLVGFTTLWSSMNTSLLLAKEIKKREPKIYIVMGGPHCSKIVEGERIDQCHM